MSDHYDEIIEMKKHLNSGKTKRILEKNDWKKIICWDLRGLYD